MDEIEHKLGKSDGKISVSGGCFTPLLSKPPDGGWGWAVTFAAFMLILLVDGVCFTFGIFYPEFLEYFDDSKSKTAVIGSVINGAQMGLGPVSAALVNKFGCRKVAMLGSFFSSLGFFLCTFSPNADIMIVLYGTVGGCGFGLMYLSSIVMVGQYFEKKRALATGIAVCGSGIGNFVFAPLCEFLLQCYTWKGAMWIISGLVLNGVVFATLFRPIEEYTKINSIAEFQNLLNETNTNDWNKRFSFTDKDKNCALMTENVDLNSLTPIYRCKSMELQNKNCKDAIANGCNDLTKRLTQSQELTDLQRSIHERHDRFYPLTREDIFYSGSLNHIQDRKCKKEFKTELSIHQNKKKFNLKSKFLSRAKQTFDFSLLLSPTFAIYGTSCFLCMLGFFIPFNFLPDLAINLNMTLSNAAFLISIIGIANTVSRIFVGLVSDQTWADSLVINNVALICGGVSTFFVPYYTEYGVMAVYSAVFGASIAAFVSLRSIIMVELMGIEKLTNAFGLVVLCQGLSSFIGPPIAGTLSDMTGSYDASFYMAGTCIGLAGVICLPLRRVALLDKRLTINNHPIGQEVIIYNEEDKAML